WQFNSTLQVNKVAEIPKGKKDSKVGLLVGLLVGFLAVGCVLGFGLFLWLKKRGRSSRKNDAETANSDVNSEFEKGTGPKRFSYRELEYATNNFDEGGKLGEGGFGGVYKGFLSDMNLNIAVKRVSKGSKQGIKEYQPEVRIISNLRHRNLVQLIGWCHERDDLLLVYEFMPNRSLDNHLFRGELILTLEVRYKIALGLASALLYLHEECEQCVIHRDIKSSNIMLDTNFNAKLGDFGLARLVDHDSQNCFGIVALEIACGKKAVDVSLGFLLVEWVWELYGIGRILEVADEKLNKNFDERQIKRLMVLGLWCAHPASKSRPSATQVINVLKFESPLPKLPLELPAPQ
ncbi:L-type lectin-domain containing receptor kinase IX.1-like, partial [Papaver somniferum]|uniref:L-type lectin-domain containing receptor kinase IX.1-like n=1 Tax=Papaver somniferum TaxID=3469 RepID=UPI000E6F7582